MKYYTNSNNSRLFDGGEGVKIVAGENAAQLYSDVLKYHVYIFVLKRVQYTLRHKGLNLILFTSISTCCQNTPS